MKKFILTLPFIFLLIQISFSQESAIKQFPLKDYVAPEIKYRSLYLNTSLFANGLNAASNNDQNSSSFNASLVYDEYINTKKHQGISGGRLYSNFNSRNSTYNDTIKSSEKKLVFGLEYGTQNRFYNQKEVFLGVHGDLYYYIYPINKETGEYISVSKRHRQQFAITPYISVGKGRIEPIESARRAMDILIAMEKNHRLSGHPDSAMIDSLAKVANRIRFKRFYDSRFKTIYQLEELDKAIQNMGLVDTADIVYFANLNDIWNYAPNFRRGSGTRFEGGLIPNFYYYYSKTEVQTTPPELDKYNSNSLGLYGFFSFSRMRPISYAWQSSLMIDLTMGYNSFQSNSEQDEVEQNTKSTHFKSLLNASWQFGYFPNTRTYAGITPYAGFSFNRDYKYDENTRGIYTGFRFDMYYYVSPRLRLTFEASATYTENFDWHVPTPFWNTVNYTNSSGPRDAYEESEIAFPIESLNTGSKKILYRAFFALSYAIF